MNLHLQEKTSFVIITALIVLLIVTVSLLPERMNQEMIRENGPIETLSAAGYFLFCLLFLYFNYNHTLKVRLAPVFFVFLLGLRELDFHARFTTMGMFKSRFFISPEVPVPEKIAVILFIAGLLAYGVYYLRHTLPAFKNDLLNRSPYALAIVCAVGCMLASKSIDGNSTAVGIILPMLDNAAQLTRTVEEILELFIPVFFIQALFQYRLNVVRSETAAV